MPFRWSAELYGWPGRWTATGTWSTGRRQEWPSHSTWLRPHHRPWRPSCPRPTRAELLGSSVARRSLARPPRGCGGSGRGGRWRSTHRLGLSGSREAAARPRATLPPGVPVRIRGPGQATWLRQGDAVLPQVVEKALLGEFAAKPQPAPGGWITIDPAWVNRHIVTAAVPILGRVTCNRAIIPQLRGALAEVVRRGLAHLVNPADYAGCYAARVIAGDPGPSLAHHAWGSAIDLNATANPQGAPPHQDPRLVSVFERWGFTWGGRWLVPDAMHFELLRLQPSRPS